MVVKINSRKMEAPLPQKKNSIIIVCVFMSSLSVAIWDGWSESSIVLKPIQVC